MNRPGLVAVVCLAAVAACSDAICPAPIFVAIQTSSVTTDVDAAMPGVQTDVRVRTSLSPPDEVTLEVSSASGELLETATVPVDDTGVATFAGVSVVNPETQLRATVDTECGHAEDELVVPVTAGTGCDLVVAPAPVAIPFFAPVGVLNSVIDPDPDIDGFQATLIVDTSPGAKVQIFENTGTGDTSIGTADANDNGTAMLTHTLLDGPRSLRALCSINNGGNNGGGGSSVAAVSEPVNVVVDITPPDCSFVDPAPGTTITPAFDNDFDLSNGIQLQVTGLVSGDDVFGEPATLDVAPVGGMAAPVTVTDVGTDGTAGGVTTIDPDIASSFSFVFGSRDHAHNTCTVVESYDVVLDGCAIAITSPTQPVTVDADGNAANGTQVDVDVQVATACAGRTVTSTCGLDNPSATVPADGQLTLRTQWCTTSPCEQSDLCTVTVSNDAGIVTSAATTIDFDDLGPDTTVAVVSPPTPCGSTVTPAADVDPASGVQVVARVTTVGAVSQQLEVTTGTGTTTVDASSDVLLTLAPGVNSLVGLSADALGNTTRTAACPITLDDLTVSFSPPAADGFIARGDGTVVGSDITFPLCGTVSAAGASVSLVIDTGAPVPATVTGTTWCRDVTLAESPPSHTIVASATAGASAGSASLQLVVDLTLPPPVLNLAATAVDRHTIGVTWESPSDGGAPVTAYVAKVATTPITEVNFDTTGTPIATGAPQAPGTPESAFFDTARLGLSYFVAVATFDAAGNRAVASTAGPISTSLDRTGGLTAPDANLGSLRLGTAIAHGRFNDDDLDDLAVSAPTRDATGGTAAEAGAVYVYFGTPLGIPATPDLVISSTVAGAHFGAGLTAIHLPSTAAGRDDLVVGAPGLTATGLLDVYRGGAGISAGARDAATADLVIAGDPASPGLFDASSLGATLVTADVDGDGQQDLVASMPTSNGGDGGIVILYGDTIAGNIHLSNTDSSGANGVIAELFADPSTPGRRLGTYLHDVGPTQGPLDPTDDLAVVFADDNTTSDSLYLLRGNGTRPTSTGVSLRSFTVGRDLHLSYTTSSTTTEWGAQVTSIPDANGDGARDLVIAAHRANNDHGQVVVVSGNLVGISGQAATSDPNATITTIDGGNNAQLGAIVLESDGVSDFDNDGVEDLLLVGRSGGSVLGYLWFGGTLPAGATTVSSAGFSFAAPSAFRIGFTNPAGALGTAAWVGDLDGDGVPDVCWGTPITNGDDGTFEVFD